MPELSGISQSLTSPEKHKKEVEVVHTLTGGPFTDHRDISMVNVYNPIYIAMTVFGLLWQGKDNIFRRKFYLLDLHTLHCCIVLLFVWFNAINYFAFYDKTDKYGSPLFLKICNHIVHVQVAFGITSNVYFKHKHVHPFVLTWENYKLQYNGVPQAMMKSLILKRVIAINTTMIIMCMIFAAVAIIQEPEFWVDYCFPILKQLQEPVPTWLIVLTTFWASYAQLAWTQGLIFCFCTNKILQEEFKQFSAEYIEHMGEKTIPANLPSSTITSDRTPLNRSVPFRNTVPNEKFRHRYLQLCSLVTKYDDVVSSFLLFLYLFSIPLIIFLMYTISGFDDSRFEEKHALFLLAVISLLFFILMVVIVTASASSLTTAVSFILVPKCSVITSVNHICFHPTSPCPPYK